MILAVWWLGVRKARGTPMPAVGHVPGAGVDGHRDLLAGGHGAGTVAITQSERTLGCCALRVRSLPIRARVRGLAAAQLGRRSVRPLSRSSDWQFLVG
jgi:hypothetical protein